MIGAVSDKDQVSNQAKMYEDEPQLTKQTVFYDFAILFFNWLYYIFFREVRTRGSFNVPKKGPAILVCAPHANQFVDPSLFMLQVKKTIGRNVSFLIAGASYRRRFIGLFARLASAIPVERAQDLLKPAEGSIKYHDFDKDPTLIEGIGTNFTTYTVKGLLGLPESNSQIEEVYSDTLLKLRKPFSSKVHELLVNGTNFKYAAKVDNSQVFQNVFQHLHNHGLIGIFPEGGSHDRTELLPLKPGVAIMALGAVAEKPDEEIKIIPCGMNYFHPNKFRSRAVIEFGTPIVVTGEDGERYKENPRELVSDLLDKVTDALNGVVVTCPDYDSLMTIQLARRLYQIPKKHVPLPLVVEMNRRLAMGYVKYQDDPRIQQLTKLVNKYNKRLSALGLKDHQLNLIENFNKFKTFLLLLQRFVKLVFFTILSLPGTILFAPVFIACKVFAAKKAKEALAKSVVKIRATDVLATWKLLFALAFAPILYVLYSLIGLYLLHRLDIGSRITSSGYVTGFISCYLILVMTTYSAFKIGEVGLDIFKSLVPLILSLTSDREEILKLKKNRELLSEQITQICNELGPSVFPDFDEFYDKGLAKEEHEHKEELFGNELKVVKSQNSLFSQIQAQGVNLGDVAIFSDITNGSQRSRASSVELGTSTGVNTDKSDEISRKIRERFLDTAKDQSDDE